jgi:UDP-glucose 4-epimerase
MRCLVTGGAGFIGSNLVDALLARDDEVTVVDNLSTGRRPNLEPALAAGADLVELDIRDGAALTELARERRPQRIFHLAAQIDVRKSLAEPFFDASVNVGGTANVLEAARASECGRVVSISTGGAIYGEGEGQELPLAEEAPIAPMSQYERLYGLSGVSLRLGNVYGPRQDPLGEAGVIAIFCGLLQEGGRPTVYGDGMQTRDYIYVGDVVSAAIAAADSDATGPINVGTGRETTVLELVEALRRLGDGGAFEPEFAPPRTGEVQRISSDPGRAERELGWRAEVGLEEGLRRTLDSL